MTLPTQYAIRYVAAVVVFSMYPAILEEIKEDNARSGVGLAYVK